VSTTARPPAGTTPTARKVINRKVRYETETVAFKKAGHPFFPFAMYHDVVVNLLIVLLIVAMAVIWHATAEPISAAHPTGVNGWLGALYETKANPAVQATEPRPEWYFLFLFELLRIFKTPWQLILATIVIPTIWMILLLMWPFVDRGRDRRLSRRPVGVALGLATPVVLIALTIAGGEAPGAAAGSQITGKAEFDSTQTAQLISETGCTTCHNFGGGGGNVGANLSSGSGRFGDDVQGLDDWIAFKANQEVGVMPAYRGTLSAKEIHDIAQFVADLKSGTPSPGL
jgi:menaquinol-cytochrome c reductase cytochrome b/c subunit